MIDMFTLQATLAQMLNADAVSCLAHAKAWLDPIGGEADDDLPEDETDTLTFALHMLRRAFPDVYFETLFTIRHNATYAQLDGLICEAVQRHGIPLESMEWLAYGIPLPAYGAVLDDPEFYAARPGVILVLACFGISPEPNPFVIQVEDEVYEAAKIIADNLTEQADEHLQQLGWLIRYLFSMTGNSSADWDESVMAETEPLLWNADDLAFALEIIQEADTVMQDVNAALAWVSASPAILTRLTENIQRVYQMKGNKDGQCKFEWTGLTECVERNTVLVA